MDEQNISTQKEKGGSTSILVLVIILLLVSNIITAYFLLMDEQEPDVERENEIVEEEAVEEEEIETEVEIPELQSAFIGDPVDLGNYLLTIEQVTTLEEGDDDRILAIEVLLENTSNNTLRYDTDWTLYDTQGYNYSSEKSKEPAFTTNTGISPSNRVPVNGSEKGWLTFEIPKEVEEYTIHFNDNVSGYSVEFTENLRD